MTVLQMACAGSLFPFPSARRRSERKKTAVEKNVYKNEALYCVFCYMSKEEGGRREGAQRQVKKGVFYILRWVQYVRLPIMEKGKLDNCESSFLKVVVRIRAVTDCVFYVCPLPCQSAYLQINRTKINVLNINVLQINGSLNQQKIVEVLNKRPSKNALQINGSLHQPLLI
jgi:hypothetical protein